VAHEGLIAAAVLLLACGSAPGKPQTVTAPVVPEPPAFTSGSHLLRFHSTRFDMSVPLPDGKSWRIDDHHAPVMRATHEATRSIVELAIWREDELVNRAMCEKHAYEKRLIPEPAGEEISTELVGIPTGWDTGIWIGADHDDKTIVGQLVAFGAFIHKCMVFRFETKADLKDASIVSDRLAFVRLRVFGDLTPDTFAVPRENRTRGAMPR
jgi:hypothetical protein